ncbi:MAG: helix-turn-helix domain-containing protein [Chloroflexi bacterium]|nr:helix-turn-helix domain-containing protein [Chloroflexota bacterium]MDA1003822.1 helix-turn-helix domain-containing protein [Chloroflexota bacterium]
MDAVRLRLLTELAEASAHLANGTTDANALHDPNLASSIDSVRLQSNDLMRTRMRELRIAAGLTQAELATRADVPRQAVSDFETGRAIVSDLVSTLAPFLGVAQSASEARPPSAVFRARTAAAGEDPVEFEVVASGTSMEPTVRHGDLLLVSPRVALDAGRIVVAKHGATWLVKRLAQKDDVLVLRSDNANEELALAEVDIQSTVVELRRTL